MLLDGRVAIITAGAGAGIGRAVAMRFLEEGVKVMLTDYPSPPHSRNRGRAEQAIRARSSVHAARRD